LNERDTSLPREEADPTNAGGDRDAQGGAGPPARPRPARRRQLRLPTRWGRQIL